MQIGRHSKQYQFFMLFLVMTISIGLFSANIAHTVNNNLEEQVRYEAGADIVLQQFWERDIPVEMTQAGQFIEEEDRRDNLRILYFEPDVSQISDWQGVKQVSKVFTKNRVNAASAVVPNRTEETRLMGIDTESFGKTAYFRSSLLSPNHHWFEYLNLLASETSAAMISRELANTLDVRPGEYITLGWPMAQQAHFVVYDIIDYWPSWNPNVHPHFVVGNLSYIQTSMAIEPYHLWISLEDDGDREQLKTKFEEERLRLTSFHDVQVDLLKIKNDAYIVGLNGSLTLGFLTALVITFVGFLLYWILSLRSRTLQYGVFRAMGMSTRQLLSMLFWEQILTTGMAVILGSTVGKITSIIFIPFFQNSLGNRGQLLPFRIIFDRNDEILVYSFAAILLIIGLSILSWMISKIRIHQAIKLGEE